MKEAAFLFNRPASDRLILMIGRPCDMRLFTENGCWTGIVTEVM